MRFALFRSRDPFPDHLDVAHGGATFRVALKKRPQARRFTLRVSNASGSIVLTTPERASFEAARRFADSHGGWIAARLARLPQRVAFTEDAIIPVRGVPHRIAHAQGQRGPRFTMSEIGEARLTVGGERVHLARRVTDALRREARKDLDAAVARHARALGVSVKRVALRDTTSRWGSCSARGHLSFSWRLILAPPSVLDYLAAHEVAHLKEMNHSPRFWAHVRRLDPAMDEAEAWLKRYGHELHRYGAAAIDKAARSGATS